MRISKRNLAKSLWLVPLVLIFGVSTAWWYYNERYPSTDDAYVKTNIVTLSARANGTVATVEVQEHQVVKAYQLLLSFDPFVAQYIFNSNKAAYNILDRLEKKSALAKLQLDQAKADLGKAWVALSGSKIYAPVAGTVEHLLIQPGNTVAAGVPLLALVKGDVWWIDANFKETQLARIKPNQPVSIELDMYPHHTFKGVVESIGSSSGATFSLFPPENASGNWVKVAQRFPVRVRIIDNDPHYPLRVGASASVTVDTTSVHGKS